MSHPFKAIGKVFKKVVHSTVGKVILGALMVGAVVLTGGAALGALPAIGSVLGSVGISGTLASVLGGAISMGAIGAVTGGLSGVLGGGGFFKGATTGFLGGALTGGLLGGAGVIGANGILGGLGSGSGLGTSLAQEAPVNLATTNAVTGATELMGNAAGGVAGAAGAGAASAGASAAQAAGAAQAGGGGMFGGLGSGGLLQLGGSLLSGFAQGKATQAEIQAQQERDKARYDRIAFNYGYKNIYGDGGDVPTDVQKWYSGDTVPLQQPAFLQAYTAQNNGLLGSAPYQSGLVPTTYDIINGQVVARGG